MARPQRYNLVVWVYVQRTGNIYRFNPPVVKDLIGAGYSGAAQYRNDPIAECYQDLGPIPRGLWRIGAMRDNQTASGHVLRQSMRLLPDQSTNVCGRSGFLIHGDNSVGLASAGCIIVALEVRRRIHDSQDGALTVVAEEAEL
jgi:hypothetical protein